ncbi:MAG TPA: hypothetical protein PKZ75_13870 [Bacteroidia bacterium]|nr:hypothetical protein [Bacteroidia bacterium]
MKIQLIEGNFDAKDALDIVTKMIHVKIKYHEDKIHEESAEEDINMRETRIKKLQKNLMDVRKHIESQSGKINLQSEISF